MFRTFKVIRNFHLLGVGAQLPDHTVAFRGVHAESPCGYASIERLQAYYNLNGPCEIVWDAILGESYHLLPAGDTP